MGDNNEIPLVFPSIAFYDTDHSNGLSPAEIEKMPDTAAAALFESVDNAKEKYGSPISQQTLSVFNKLSLEKVQGILRGISNTDRASEYFSAITKTNIDLAGNLLLGVYQAEARHNSHPENRCALLLRRVDPAHRQSVIEKLRDSNSAAADAIEGWDRLLQHAGKQGIRIFTKPTHPSSSEALAEILEKKMPPVIGFGESHGNGKKIVPGVPTTGERFAWEIMPVLARNGYYNLVIEYMPYDIAPSELEYYFHTGTLDYLNTPFIKLMMDTNLAGEIGAKTFMAILLSARSLRDAGYPMNIYGGSATIDDWRTFARNQMSLDTLMKYITIHTAAQVSKLIQSGNMVVTYNGGLHNDINEEWSGTSVYRLLTHAGEIAPGDYLEVDLVVPPYVDETDIYWNIYMRFSPKTGVYTSGMGDSAIIVFPDK